MKMYSRRIRCDGALNELTVLTVYLLSVFLLCASLWQFYISGYDKETVDIFCSLSLSSRHKRKPHSLSDHHHAYMATAQIIPKE